MIDTDGDHRCGKNIGMFINIRRCAILYLHETNGAWAEAPYLDAYGETDVLLKYGPQMLWCGDC